MIRQLIELLEKSESTVFFGGAGVSTESGIPDFRGADGLYTAENDSEIAPEEILHHRFFAKNPHLFYEYYRSNMIYPYAEPNCAHIALAKLESAGKLSAIITQNIDGLHQKAGAQNVIELHGSARENYCVRCGKRYGLEHIVNAPDVPTCSACGGLVRPDIVLYGEGLHTDSWTRAEEAIADADLLIVGGTSLTVQPAASLVADFYGEHLVIINQAPTPYDEYAELIIREPIGETFGCILDEML